LMGLSSSNPSISLAQARPWPGFMRVMLDDSRRQPSAPPALLQTSRAAPPPGDTAAVTPVLQGALH
jgi:hypothetical protein